MSQTHRNAFSILTDSCSTNRARSASQCSDTPRVQITRKTWLESQLFAVHVFASHANMSARTEIETLMREHEVPIAWRDYQYAVPHNNIRKNGLMSSLLTICDIPYAFAEFLSAQRKQLNKNGVRFIILSKGKTTMWAIWKEGKRSHPHDAVEVLGRR